MSTIQAFRDVATIDHLQEIGHVYPEVSPRLRGVYVI